MNYFSSLPQLNPIAVLVLFIWAMFWKILALWRAAKGDQKYWFVGLMIINTFGIVEIIFLFKFAKNKLTIEDIKKSNFLPN